MSVTMAFGLLTTFIGGYFYSRVKMDEKNAVNYAPVPGSEDEASSTIGSFCSTHKWKTCSTHKWKPSERKYALCAIAVVVGVLALFTLNEVKPERVRSNGPFASSGGLVNYSMFSMNVSIGELKNRIETIKGDIQAGNFTHASELLGMENALPNITATSVTARGMSSTKLTTNAAALEDLRSVLEAATRPTGNSMIRPPHSTPLAEKLKNHILTISAEILNANDFSNAATLEGLWREFDKVTNLAGSPKESAPSSTTLCPAENLTGVLDILKILIWPTECGLVTKRATKELWPQYNVHMTKCVSGLEGNMTMLYSHVMWGAHPTGAVHTFCPNKPQCLEGWVPGLKGLKNTQKRLELIWKSNYPGISTMKNKKVLVVWNINLWQGANMNIRSPDTLFTENMTTPEYIR